MAVGVSSVLLLGANGMLGHRIWLRVRDRPGGVATVRPGTVLPPSLAPVAGGAEIRDFDAMEPTATVELLDRVRPDTVVNAIGVVKQRVGADPRERHRLNTELPLQLAVICERQGARLIHVSTDCVFSGVAGLRTESDVPDPVDDYGRSKLAGEPSAARCVVLRTSIVGRELSRMSGLLEWSLGAATPIDGWSRAWFSGVSTIELARVVRQLIDDQPDLVGLFHVAGPAIDKASFLGMALRAFGRSPDIRNMEAPVIDRTLDGSRFAAATGYVAPSWETMIAELATDTLPYDAIRRMARRA